MSSWDHSAALAGGVGTTTARGAASRAGSTTRLSDRRLCGGGGVGRRIAERVEAFPSDALGVLCPELIGIRVAASGAFLCQRDGIRCMQARADVRQLIVGFNLESQMIHTGGAAALRDGEVHPRVVEHPFRIIRLHDGRGGTKESGVEPNAGFQSFDVDVDMEAFHDVVSLGRQQEEDEQSAVGEPAQQFSVR